MWMTPLWTNLAKIGPGGPKLAAKLVPPEKNGPREHAAFTSNVNKSHPRIVVHRFIDNTYRMSSYKKSEWRKE